MPLVFVISIAKGSNYSIRLLWINALLITCVFILFFSLGSGFLWGKRGLGLRRFVGWHVLVEKKVGGLI